MDIRKTGRIELKGITRHILALAVMLPLLAIAEPFSTPTDGVWLGGPPSAADLDALKAQGVELVIDMRTPAEGVDETASAAEARGIRYINLPVGRDLADAAVVEQAGGALDAAREAGAGVLMHCASGNRAGEVWALHRVAGGADPAQALAEAEAAGTRGERLERLDRELQKRHGHGHGHGHH